jgi:hypothetical protein
MKQKKVWGIRCKTCKVELLNVGGRAEQREAVLEMTLAEKKRHEEKCPGHRVAEVEETYAGG